MRFSAEWIPDGENASAEERSTLCALRIHLGEEERNVTAFYDFDARRESDHIVLPAVHLAEGIACSWWRIFGGRDVATRVLSWRMGFALPNLRFEFDGSTLAVACERSDMLNPPVAFLNGGVERIARGAAEAALADFLDAVVAKLNSDDLADVEASAAWRRVCESREDAEEQAFCEAAGAMGLDPYVIADADGELIDAAGDIFEGEALVEFLAGLRERPGGRNSRSDLVRWVADRKRGDQSRLPGLIDVADQIGSGKSAADYAPPWQPWQPWQKGQQVAQALRRALDVPPEEPVTIKTMLTKLGSKRFRRQTGPAGVFAVVDRADDIHIHLRKRGTVRWAETAEKFAFFRGVGDAICYADSSRSAINDLHRAERQAVGRAFAAEFIAPAEAVLGMWDDGRDVDEIAGRFGVNPQVIAHGIDNAPRYAAS